MRQRENELWESGIAHFIFPDPSGKEAQVPPPFNGAYDHTFGKGATAMLMGFQDSLKSSFAEAKFKSPPIIGLDIRPLSHLQSIQMFLMALGSEIVVLGQEIRENDPTWTQLTSRKINRVYHMPTILVRSSE